MSGWVARCVCGCLSVVHHAGGKHKCLGCKKCKAFREDSSLVGGAIAVAEAKKAMAST